MLSRIRTLYGVLFILGFIIAGRLFQLQIIQGQEYYSQAISEQQKKYEIPAERGRIYVRESNNQKVPVVLNQTLKTLYADPRYVKDPLATAQSIASVIGGKIPEYEEILSQKDRFYVVLAKKLSITQSEQIDKLDLSGIGLQDATYRSYPEGGNLAAQVLGFVNYDGVGQYGIEGYLNDEIAGQPGQLKAVTDVNGIPLTTSEDSILKDAIDGTDVVLTLDRTVQKFVEQALESGVKNAKGKSGSAIVMDPYSGAIIAMANYPSYDSSKFFEVEDGGLLVNSTITIPYEVGSVIKPFTMSAGLNENKVNPDSTYYDPGYVQVDDRRIENAGGSGGLTRTMTEVIQNSVNTGMVYVLNQLSGGKSINQTGRNTLYDYFYNRFGFGNITGIEQEGESAGIIYKPDDVQGNNVRYANMTFGQGISLTLTQLISAYASLVNGGTYYQPHLVHSRINRITAEETINAPKVLRSNIISSETSKSIIKMMEQVVEHGGGYSAKRPGYIIGGKTGTAQKLNPDGTYSDYLETGTFIGFGAGNTPQYIIVAKVDEPGIPGYAGTVAAAPIFADISNWLIDYYRIAPIR